MWLLYREILTNVGYMRASFHFILC